MVIPFLKMHGAANDFVVIDHRRPFLPRELGELVARLCDRRRGIGADGVLLLEAGSGADASMRYFNADGGAADYCGNGARCLARLGLDLGLGHAGRLRLETAVGVQTARRVGSGIEIEFGYVEAPSEPLRLEACERSFTGRAVRAGVPHFVVEFEDLKGAAVTEWGRSLRRHPQFGPEGANVDFVARRGEGVAMRTYVRGVEGETLACGSGAIATAIWAASEGLGSPVRVLTSGGDPLIVGFVRRGSGYDVTLTGPAEVAYRGEWRDTADSVSAVTRGGS